MLQGQREACSESGSSVLMTKGCRAFLIAGNGNHGAATNSVAAAKKYDGPRATRFRDGRTTAGPLKLRRGPAAPAAHARARAPSPESAQAYLAQNLPERIRAGNSRETHRTEKKAFRAQSARQGGTEPGTTRFRDGRTTTRPPAPRRGPGAPAAQPRPTGPDLESAQI